MVNEENEDSAQICVFIIEGTTMMYIGELYYDVEDKERNRLIFKRVLVQVINYKEKTSSWLSVPSVGRNSTIEIDRRVVRGILVKDVDPTAVAAYKKEWLQRYSPLHLA